MTAFSPELKINTFTTRENYLSANEQSEHILESLVTV